MLYDICTEVFIFVRSVYMALMAANIHS